MILLFSHQLTPAQIKEAENNLKINEFVSLPKDLQALWSNVPSHLNELSDHLEEIKIWLHTIVRPQDYILIQGEFGVVHYFVNWSFQNNLIPLYATTKRRHKETLLEDGEVEIKKIFVHKQFRKYIPIQSGK